LSCSEPPEGFSQWSLRLLADKTVELDYIDAISHEAVRRILKKTNSSLGGKRGGANSAEAKWQFCRQYGKHEPDQGLRCHGLFVEHEPHLASSGDRRNQMVIFRNFRVVFNPK